MPLAGYEIISLVLIIVFFAMLRPLWQIRALIRYEKRRKSISRGNGTQACENKQNRT